MVITTREAIVASFDAPSKLSAAGSTELSMRCVNGESPETGSSTGLDSSGYSIGTPLRRQIPRSATPTGRASPVARGLFPAAVAGPRAATPTRETPTHRRRLATSSPATIVEDLDSDSDFFVRGDGERLLKGGALELGGAAVFGLLVATARPGRSAAAVVDRHYDVGAALRDGGSAKPRRRRDAVVALRRWGAAPRRRPLASYEIEARESPDPPAAAAAPPAQPEPAAPPPSAASSPYELARFLGRSPPREAPDAGDAPSTASSAPSAEEPEHRGPSPYDLACELRRSAPDVAMEGLLWRRGAATPWKKRHASLVLDGRRTRLVYRNGDARVLGECFLRDLADVVSVDGGGRTGACFDLTFAGGGEPTSLCAETAEDRDAWTRRSSPRPPRARPRRRPPRGRRRASPSTSARRSSPS
ncbi:hypothetical protein JL721_6109 [Aureococcus anophagefferens]|nr:hypothetical protein JL721_6109 [Aureococcus anophagefferens]